MEKLSSAHIAEFQQIVWNFFKANRRQMPWRVAEPDGSFDPYKILVSEMMLQQTQVARVIPKFEEFLKRFPTIEALVAASLGDVLRVWQGLGYNRRVKYLHFAAQALVTQSKPWRYEDLVALTGVGSSTAAAVLVYAHNQPLLFVETNIRTVFIHHFFKDQTGVTDRDILELLEQTLDQARSREFYWALMDWGTYLKTTVGNLAKQSKHYTKQSSFAGSRRAVRGQVIRLLAGGEQTLAELKAHIQDERLRSVLVDLSKEKLIRQTAKRYHLA